MLSSIVAENGNLRRGGKLKVAADKKNAKRGLAFCCSSYVI